MPERRELPPKITIGIDLGDRYSRFCCVNQAGTVSDEGRVATTVVGLEGVFRGREAARIVLEVGTHSPWVSRCLATLGHEVLVANPRQLRLLYASDRKNDRVDAESLARVARLDPVLLAPIQHRGLRAQADLALIRARDGLVRTRTQLINHVRGSVKAMGGRLPKTSTPAFARRIASAVPDPLRPAVAPVLQIIDALSEQIRAYDQRIERLADTDYPETRVLRQVTGVGALTALCYVLTLEDPQRFRTSRAVGAYLGLRPRQHDSGARTPQLSITKRGDGVLRKLLVSSAHYILGPFGPDCDLRRWGLALAQRGGANAKKRAVVAVARKLAGVLYRLWLTGARYEPLRLAARRTAA
jgi:transposase